MIEINNIYKSYGKQKVLNGVDLQIKKETIQALLGANGAGKSTLINIISGLLLSDKGEFHIDNEKITTDSYTYRSKIGYIFETPIYIEHFSAIEYLTFVAKMYKIPKSDYLSRITELIDFFELPKDNKRITQFSKGMQSKVSLAAALIHNPKYLILDEPFDGVDFVSVQNITKLFKQMAANGVTILITSHQYDVVADLCDNFALLKDGKIIFNLPMSDLEIRAKEKFLNEKVPVKAYLENIMNEKEYKNLSWT